jgi:hypothetical protein
MSDAAQAPAITEETLKARAQLRVVLYHLLETADRLGLVVTVSQVPRPQLAMGNYDTLLEIREKRNAS